MLRAVLWDFGRVILTSPFDAFARYETEAGLPIGTIRTINATNPHTNAWARLERAEVTLDEFAAIFEAEGAELGHQVDGQRVLGLLDGAVRPEMVEALRRCKERYKVVCLTNNILTDRAQRPEVAEVMGLFDVVVESSKVGVRKPEPEFFHHACRLLEVEPPECVFLDDLGINLKPAAAMGMRTIKVVDPVDALDQLWAILGE